MSTARARDNAAITTDVAASAHLKLRALRFRLVGVALCVIVDTAGIVAVFIVWTAAIIVRTAKAVPEVAMVKMIAAVAPSKGFAYETISAPVLNASIDYRRGSSWSECRSASMPSDNSCTAKTTDVTAGKTAGVATAVSRRHCGRAQAHCRNGRYCNERFA
jgi:hypothetical protein